MDNRVILSPPGNSRNSGTLSRLTHRENLFAGAPEKNGAGFGVLTLGDKCEVLIANFLDFQQARSCPNIVFSQLLWSADYPGPTGSIDQMREEEEPGDFRYFDSSPESLESVAGDKRKSGLLETLLPKTQEVWTAW